MEVINGARDGAKTYYIYNNYVYVVDRQKNNVKYMRCRRPQCPGRLVYRSEEDFSERRWHSHDQDVLNAQIIRKKQYLRSQSGNQLTSYWNIYQVAVEMFPLAAQFYAYPAAYRAMRRVRLRNLPRLPRSVIDIATILNDPQWRRWKMDIGERHAFFRGADTALDGGEVALFIAEDNAAMLRSNGAKLLIDGTFKTVPSVDGAYQLVTVHVVDDTVPTQPLVYPCAFALLSGKSKDIYDKLLQMLSAEVGNMNPASAMCDFEDALRMALRDAFYGIEIISCWFHFAQAVHRKAASVGLTRRVVNIGNCKAALRRLMALPLLPAHYVPQAYLSIVTYIRDNDLMASFRPLLSYMRKQWFESVEPLEYSVFRQTVRTNNCAERLHLTYLDAVGTHPNFWIFYRSMRLLSGAQVAKRMQHQNAQTVRHAMKRKYRLLNERMSSLWDRIDHPLRQEERITPAAAIAEAGHFLERLQRNLDR